MFIPSESICKRSKSVKNQQKAIIVKADVYFARYDIILQQISNFLIHKFFKNYVLFTKYMTE